jgi:UDP-N-acetyl-D-mannosaminuronic acid dehydrogenase
MSTPMIQAEPKEIDTPEKRGKRSVTIIGCEHASVIHAILFADAGFKVTCADADNTKVSLISKGKLPFLNAETAARLRSHARAGCVKATNDIGESVSHSDVIVFTTSTKISAKKRADYSDTESLCKKIGSSLQRGSLMIVTSPTGIGVTEGLIKETLENTSGFKVGSEFGLAYGPFQPSYAETLEEITNRQRIVAATDKNSLRAAAAILETLTKKGVTNTTSVKTAEVAVLLEVLQRDVRLALANETAILCERAGVDFVEAQRLIAADTGGQMASPTVADDGVGDEAYLLLEDAENLNMKFRIADAARCANEDMVKHVTNTVKDALKNCGKTQKRARIGLLGASQTPNVQSPLKRNAKKIVEILETRGAKVSLYDPYVSKKEIADAPYHFKKTMTEAIERADCMIILTAHDQFKRMNLRRARLAMKMPAAIVDLEGIIEPSKIEKEGFIYRGLGRGIWTK